MNQDIILDFHIENISTPLFWAHMRKISLDDRFKLRERFDESLKINLFKDCIE